jgi:hypothetical protein
MFAIAVVGGGIFLYSRHVRTEPIARESVTGEFERARQRFAGQKALIEFRDFDDVVVHRSPTAERQTIQAVHVMAYDDRDGELTRVEVPGWLVRLMTGSGRFRVANVDLFDSEHGSVTLEDLERHGPGLVLDAPTPRGSRVLVWTE